MSSKDLKNLKKEIFEVRLLLDGLSAYQEIPAPIIELAISKTDQLKALLIELKETTLDVPENSITNSPKLKEELIKDRSEAEIKAEQVVEDNISKPNPPVQKIVIEEPVLIMEDKVEVQVETVTPPKETAEVILDKEEEVRVEAKSIVNTAPVSTKETRPEKAVLADTISSNKKVVNDLLPDSGNHTLGKRIEKSSIPDLKRAIPINDRFRFQRDLFNNNVSLFNETLTTINAMLTFEDAEEFINQKFNWDKESSSAQDFQVLLTRRFVK